MLALLALGATAITARSYAEAKLNWKDNSDNETGFYIEKSENGFAFERIANLPANSTQFTDSSTESGKLYFYRVQAYNAFGVSGYTNISKFEIPDLINYHDWILRFLNPELNLDLVQPPLDLIGTASSQINLLDTAPDKTLLGAQIPNLLCYTHGINPFKPDYTLLAKPTMASIDGRNVAVIERAVFKYSIGLETILQQSTDLITWTDLPLDATVTGETSLHRWERIRLPENQLDKFYRLKISLDSSQSLLSGAQ